MTKKEREILSKKISSMIKRYKYEWNELKEEILDYGYQSYYSSSDAFREEIEILIRNLTREEKDILILEWKTQKSRIQFESDEFYIKQYKLFVMEELVSRALRATSRM